MAPNLAAMLAAAAATLLVRFLSTRNRPKDYSEGNEQAEIGDPEEASSTGVKSVNLAWDNVTCVVLDKAGNVTKTLLRNVSGEAKAGKLLAIMGPSGSGKTTLLNVLAGQLSASPHLQLTGYLNSSSSASKHRLAYVRQEDLFFSQLTVRETLSLAAELQLPKTWKALIRDRYVEELLYRLGLVSCADTIVGDAKVRGISGGEKKRLSIACELIASPSVIFADEPTTGLDAFQAEKVMETLRKLAQEGHTVVCSIHQPRGSIYSKFDNLVLLSAGSIVYAGPAHDQALSYFAELGYNCPEHVNPAEYFADLISIDYSSSESEAATCKKVASLVDSFAAKGGKIISVDQYSLTSSDEAKDEAVTGKCPSGRVSIQRGGWWQQFGLLLRRAWMQTTRDRATNKVRGSMSVASAIIFGSIFWRMGWSQTSIQDRMGLLQVAAINTAMAALTKTVNVFPKERAIVQRERAKGSYGLSPYLLAKLVAEAPVSAAFPLLFGCILYPMTRLHPSLQRFCAFSGVVTVEAFAASAMGLTVGAMVPTTEAALALGPSLMTVFIVFGGYYVNSENTPAIFRWIPEVSLIRWAFQALSINEFKGLKFEAKNATDLTTGEQVLERLSFGERSVAGALANEGRIALFWYWLTFFLLKRNKARFQALEAPAAVSPQRLRDTGEDETTK